MTDMKNKALDYIIDKNQIFTVFQPIISLRDGSVFGHEALSRITCISEIKSPDELFSIAGSSNRLWDLELLCRTKALETAFIFLKPPYDKKLFLNVNPNIMHDKKFKEGFTKEFLSQYNISAMNIIFEITERNVIEDISGFRTTVAHYKNQDYGIAIDDVGSGYSGLNLISEVNPNFIKLDINLIRGIDKDSLKFALVKGMVELSKVSAIQIIAEGIETYAELDVLVHLGVQFGQGYFIQKPDFPIFEIRAEVLEALKEINLKKNHVSQYGISSAFISNLSVPTETINADDKVLNLYDRIKNNLDCFGFCVVEDNIPIGIITREKLALKLSGHFGFTLHQNKMVSELMDLDFLSVDFKTPIAFVSSIAMSRSNDKLYDFIIVTQNERYLGTVTIKDLLQRTTELEVSVAKHQNPLTGLPGNMLIEQKLDQCTSNGGAYTVAYLDIDNFKAYNDVYGFEKGDLIIKLLANILRECMINNPFIGHIGGDDFVVVLEKHVTSNYFDNIISWFNMEIVNFYHHTDIANGFIVSANRHGIIEKFPITSLTCVAINNAFHSYSNAYDISETLAMLKKSAKQANMKTII